jgi:enoyl-CoA hydratase
MTPSHDVEVRAGRSVSTVILDRPKALNALTTAMVETIKQVIDTSEQPVVIRSAHPEAFCAGGDIRAVRENALAGNRREVWEFFAAEYAMNLAIAEAGPPVVSVVDGICMGGGLGIAGHSAVHVVTERASIAMPESAIGFFPDVGASHLLAAAPGHIGLYLGMTGAAIGADDAIYSGLATHRVAADELPEFLARLEEDGVGSALAALHRGVDLDSCVLQAHRADIDRCFSACTVDEVIDRVAATRNGWGATTLDQLSGASPQSLIAAFTLIRRAAERTLRECLIADLAAAEALVHTPDFAEGVGAKLLDKRAPRWTSTLQDFAADAVEPLR